MAQTSGLLQRLKWASNAVFAFVGPSMSASQLFALWFDPEDHAVLASHRAMSSLLSRALAAQLPITLTHGAGSTIIEGVDLRFAQVRVDAVEVTQSIQNLSQSVPLVALKRTVVRVYMSSRLPASVTVSGTLAVVRPGGATRLLASVNSATLDPTEFGQLDAFRANIAKSLNFVLPTDVTAAGMLDVRLASLVATATGSSVMFGPPGSFDRFEFTPAPPLRLAIVGFSYQSGTPGQTFTPTATDFGFLSSWLRRAYPVAQVVASQQVVTASASVPFSCGSINAELAAIRALDVSGGVDARTHYYGLVSDGGFFMRGCATIAASPDPTAVGSGPTGTGSWGWDFDGSYGDWYGGHELGHTYGRLHPGFCGESNDDNSYPFTGGQLASVDGSYAGLDVGDAVWGLPVAALDGTVWHDVMTYCDRQWLSSYTYAAVRARLAAEDALSPGAGGGAGRPDQRFPKGAESGATRSVPRQRTLVSLVAQLNLAEGTGRIAFLNPVTRGQILEPDPSGPVVIRVLDRAGKPVGEYRVGVKRFSDVELGEDDALANIILPLDQDAARIELYVGERLVDSHRGSSEPVAIEDVRIQGDRSNALELAWGPGGKSVEGVAHNVQVSDDRGRTWRTVAVGVRSQALSIPADALPADGDLLFRIQASDGFRSADATVEWPGRTATSRSASQD